MILEHIRKHKALVPAALAFMAVIAACVTQGPSVAVNGWWAARGPVVPHDTFPANCGLCHVGQNWQSVKDDFVFDHEAETGLALDGSHADAKCLRCHNDRGPAQEFQARGCVGCHEDVHFGQLGPTCTSCHQEVTWRPEGITSLHNRTRFPLVGVHAATACHRCHPGGEVGKFVPIDIECLTCHQDDLARALNPPHLALGFVNDCDRCHMPTTWNQAELDPTFPAGSAADPARNAALRYMSESLKSRE